MMTLSAHCQLRAGLAAIGLALPLSVAAVPIVWDGGNANWDAVAAKWNPDDEPDPDDEAVFNTNHSVNLANANESIIALTMSGGIDLSLNGSDLTVSGGAVSLSGAGTALDVPGGSTLNADDVFVNAGASLRLRGGTLTMAEAVGEGVLTIAAGGEMGGFGTIVSTDAIAAANTAVLTLSGDLTVFTFDLFSAGAGTLAINVPINGRVDLDQASATVNITRNDTLEVNGAAHLVGVDPYGGTMNLSEGATIDMNAPWGMNSGFINVDAEGLTAGTAGAAAAIAGASFSLISGTINLPTSLDSLRFSAPFSTTGGVINNHGLVIFDNTATIFMTDFQMNGASASISVTDGHTATITKGNFDVGGTGAATNVTTIGNGAVLNLRIDFDAGAIDSLDHAIELNGGELDVVNQDDGFAGGDTAWNLSGGEVNANTGSSVLDGGPLLIQSETINVHPGAVLHINAASVELSGPTINVDGDLNINAPSRWNASAVSLNGTGTFRPGVPTISNNADVVWTAAVVDWDDDGATTVEPGSSLTINANAIEVLAGTYDGTIHLDSSDLTVNTPGSWRMDGVVNIDNVSQVPTINGARMVVGDASDGTINVGAGGGAGIHDMNAPLTLRENGVINVAAGATFQVDGDSIFEGGQVTGAGNYAPASTNTVNGDVTFDAAQFNFDRGSWTINADATLTVNVADYDSDSATNVFNNATISINGGRLITNVGGGVFVVDNALVNMNAPASGTANWSGTDSREFGNDAGAANARLNVSGPGIANLATVAFFSDAAVTINAGATLHLGGETHFWPANGINNASFTGDGALWFANDATFHEPTTLNVGEVDLDVGSSVGRTITIDAGATINADVMGSFGNVNADGQDDVLQINGLLTVNLSDPNGAWTVNAPAVVNIDSPSPLTLSGSDVNLLGEVNVTGLSQWDARAEIGGTVHLLPGLLGLNYLHLNGGSQVDPNRLNGGVIDGFPLCHLAIGDNRALVGHGTIDAILLNSPNAALLADDGTLVVAQSFVSLETIGTSDVDGVLDMALPWYTSAATYVQVNGGEIRGATIANDGANGIMGHGLLSASTINNTRIDAAGGALVIETAANDNDWDGATDAGQLNAVAGDLELHDNDEFPFAGAVNVGAGRQVLVDGFALQFEPGATLNLTQGTYRMNNVPVGAGSFAGAIVVNAGGPSTLATPGDADFQNGSTTTLNDDLRLNANLALVRVGAVFVGDGALINLPNRSLMILDGVASGDLAVLIVNQGVLQIGNPLATPGQASASDLQQDAAGRLVVDLGGTGPGDFDRLSLTGTALLDGELFLERTNGYVPALGEAFGILSATGGVSGTFASVHQPAGMPAGLRFDVVYSPTEVQAVVGRIFSADFDVDGDVDDADLAHWQVDMGLSAHSDADGDGDSDGADFLAWQQQFGSGLPATESVARAPEPAGLVLALWLVLMCSARRRLES